MPSTGTAYGLEQRGSVDKRYDFERSTDSAFLLLKNLYQKYRSWPLAIAAYNCGDKRILDESRVQGSRNYYDLRLPQETERYVFRILAIKAVLSSPGQYGYSLPKGWGYQELKPDRVHVLLSRPVPIQTVASAAGTTYREIKSLNPIFRSDDIPAGNHEIKLPSGSGKAFEQNFKAGNVGFATASNETAQESVTETGKDRPAPAEPEMTQSVAPSRAEEAVRSAKSVSPKTKGKRRLARADSRKSKQKAGVKRAGSHESKKTARIAKSGSTKVKQGSKSVRTGLKNPKKKIR